MMGAVAASVGAVRGQDMSVYTTVSPVTVGDEKPPVIARSLTLFHAGKVYDYMEDLGEVVIFEPVNNRFIILNGNYVATRVEHSELQQFLKVAQFESENYLQELSLKSGREDRATAALLEFQLQPKFEEQYDPTLDRLALAGGPMRYDVQTARVETAALVEQYLTYADSAARLNFVLHPGSAYPEPRLKLNASLREKGLLPIMVRLETRRAEKTALRADHKYQWELQASDKAHINKWERLLESDELQWVGFREYQQQLLADLDEQQ
jgi:hypothetical protein